MKFYVKQVRPEYQDGSYLLDDDFYAEEAAIYGNSHLKDYWAEKIMDAEEIINELLYNYENMDEDDTIRDVVEFCLDTKFSDGQIEKFKYFLDNYDCRETEENNCFIMSMITGKNWNCTMIRGCCQGDWQYLYYTDELKDSVEIIESIYFNTGDEYIVHDEETAPESAEEISGYFMYIPYVWKNDNKKSLAENIGCNVEDIVLYEYKGEKSISIYEIA